MTKDTLAIVFSISSLISAILSLIISYRSYIRDNIKLIFEAYYVYEDYEERKSDDYENICLIIRNIGRRTANIKKVGLYIGKNNYENNYNKIPKLLPGDYTSRDFVDILMKEPIEIKENEEIILDFRSYETVFASINNFLKTNGQKGIIAVLDSRGKTHYIPIVPSMKFVYSIK